MYALRNRLWSLLLAELAWLLLAGCSVGAIDQGDLPGGLTPRTAGRERLVEGRLTPRRYVEIGSYSGGRAADVLVEEGDWVEPGQVLIRLDGYEEAAAEVARAELAVLLSRQALEDLYREAELALAEAEVRVAEAVDDQAFAEDRYQSYSRPTPQEHIDQAYANMVLAENRMKMARSDLEKAERRFANKNHIIWEFINQRKFKLLLTQLKAELADSERRYWDSKDKYQDLIEPVDEVELGLRAGELAIANARLDQARRERDDLLDGPDPDRVEAAVARVDAAESRLAAARTAHQATQLVAPLEGRVVRLDVGLGEWIATSQPAVVVADLSDWIVETENLGENLIPDIYPGSEAELHLFAYPNQELNGRVESVDLYYREDEGDIYYNAQIELNDPILNPRWGMTVEIEFK